MVKSLLRRRAEGRGGVDVYKKRQGFSGLAPWGKDVGAEVGGGGKKATPSKCSLVINQRTPRPQIATHSI